MTLSPTSGDANLVILLLAAGASTRMRGGDKLMESVAGQPLIAHLAQQARATGFSLFVTLPDLDHPRAGAIHGAKLIPVPDTDQGMSASIRAGVANLPDQTAGVMILPADMPEITTADFRTLSDQFDGPNGTILRASSVDDHGQPHPGHPVLFPRRCFHALKTLTGDSGAKALLRVESVKHIPLPGRHALTDLDTPEDWAAWRADQNR
ncbi:nucleotidyltransferase family protein [Tritonibacter mobilis]|uniref:nucleotidyltransferase family protein n=1 Tax=Tritonibacter mobilis TaxID=379347 RepID=UPI001C093F9D|nr:nucleotidyltransferase family protein [Tritonibacter mobilis]MBU3035242.1 nucleotidyltransferase family protein [Tritonibacter mobilis]WHQ83703.1 nucleotidyltransferase family protein [Tritonibacter mobilis]